MNTNIVSNGRLQLTDIITIDEINIEIAVVTQMIYPDNPEKQAYETMIFSMDTDKGLSRATKQYQTEEDARKGHQQIVAWLRIGKYKLVPIKWYIEFTSS